MNILIYVVCGLLLVVLILIVGKSYFNCDIQRYFVLKALNKLENCSFEIIDNDEVVFASYQNKNIDLKNIPKIYIHNSTKFFDAVYHRNEVGLGEAYTNGWWSSNDAYSVLLQIYNSYDDSLFSTTYFSSLSTKSTDDKKYIKHHYDVGNDFYDTFLKDDLHAYSCGIWSSPEDTLNQAQYNKVDTIIDKLAPKPKQEILDIGCGWGNIAKYVADSTGCNVTGITIADEQHKHIIDQKYSNVSCLNMDYRNLGDKKYDHIYSIGMFEHVRYTNYTDFFKAIKRCLKPNGRILLHTIVDFQTKDPKFFSDLFVTKYIFPGGQLPNNDWITDTLRKCGLTLVHTEHFGGQHYAKTLAVWRANMMKNSEYIIEKYGIELLRKYEYYMMTCEVGFTNGGMGIGHYLIVNSPNASLNNSFTY